MKIASIFFSVVLILMISCAERSTRPIASRTTEEVGFEDGYSRTNTRNSTSSTKEVNALGNLTLDNYLRRVPGVNIQGDGPYSSVTIRGISSINSGWGPLFILNGSPIEGGFAAVYNMVNPNEIKSVSVLKDPATTGIYGTRGANGVIVITLKK
jgi:TonB-dependent SusC/RagA subfamily outer membrane receptor